jgi:hypothetical protein
MLKNVNGTEAMSRATLFQWWKRFKARNTWVLDNGQRGRPSNVITSVNIDKAKLMLKDERRLSLRELAGSFNVSLESAHHIVTVEEGMSKECTRYVHCYLCDK